MGQIEESALRQYLSSTELTQDRLKEILNYDPDTGTFIWLESLGSQAIVGEFAGGWSDTYYRININGISHYAHVLAWFYIYGVWCLVDHKDRDASNNRISNLRAATKQQNTWNQGVRCTNLLGVKGVQKRGRKFRAYITVNYRTMHLGTFNTLEEAIYARTTAAERHFGEFANG